MKYIPNFIRRDFARKFIAMLFAFLVWWKISMQIGNEEIIREIPLRIIESQEIVYAGEYDPPNVNITVRAPSRRRMLLSPADFKIEIHLPQKDPGGQRVVEFDVIRDAEIKKPFGLKVLSVDPEKIALKLDRRAQKILPVIARFTGSLSEDFACGEIKIRPETVRVHGPESALKNLDRAQTEPIALDPTIKENFERAVALDAQNPRFTFLPQKLLVHVEIYRKHERRIFRGLPISLMSGAGLSPSVRKMLPTNVDVTVSGPKNVVEMMDGREIIPFVRWRGDATAAEQELKVECHLPRQDLKIISINPDTIKVSFARDR